MQTYLIQVHVT